MASSDRDPSTPATGPTAEGVAFAPIHATLLQPRYHEVESPAGDLDPACRLQLLCAVEEHPSVPSLLRGLLLEEFLADVHGRGSLPTESPPSAISGGSLDTFPNISSNVRLSISPKGTGEVIIEGDTSQPRVTFFFEAGLSTGFRKVHVPCAQPRAARGDTRRVVRILLVNLASPRYPHTTAPLGIITLGGYLRSSNTDGQVAIGYFDLQLENIDALHERIGHFRPDIVGLSVQFGAEESMFELLDGFSAAASARSPLIVLGNVLPTYAAAAILRRHPQVVCVVGRGEPALRSLVDSVSTGGGNGPFFDLPNACFLSGSTIYEIGAATFDLAALGLADWRLFSEQYPLDRYQELWMEASRGCPQKKNGIGCSFCAIMPSGDSRDWIARPPEALVQELEVLAELGVRHVRFADEEFMAGQTQAALDLALVLVETRRALLDRGVRLPTFDFAIRVDDVYKRARKRRLALHPSPADDNDIRRQALNAFKSAGLVQVYLGLEAGSARQLKRLYKAASPEDNSRAIAILREISIRIAGGWIMIDPLMEGLQDVEENIEFIINNRLLPIRAQDDFVTNSINRMRVLEGSPFVDLLRRQHLLGDLKPNLLEYRFRYKDPLVGKLAHLLDEWEAESAVLMYAAKSLVGVSATAESPAEPERLLAQHLFGLKQLDFELVKRLVRSGAAESRKDWRAIIEELRAARSEAIHRMHADSEAGLLPEDLNVEALFTFVATSTQGRRIPEDARAIG